MYRGKDTCFFYVFANIWYWDSFFPVEESSIFSLINTPVTCKFFIGLCDCVFHFQSFEVNHNDWAKGVCFYISIKK